MLRGSTGYNNERYKAKKRYEINRTQISGVSAHFSDLETYTGLPSLSPTSA